MQNTAECEGQQQVQSLTMKSPGIPQWLVKGLRFQGPRAEDSRP